MLQMCLKVVMSAGANRKAPQLFCMYNIKGGSKPRQAGLLGKGETHLCPCCAISIALRAGTGEPPSVTLRTSIDFLSGRRFPCLFSIGESTRFLGGSLWKENTVSWIWPWLTSHRLVKSSLNNLTLTTSLTDTGIIKMELNICSLSLLPNLQTLRHKLQSIYREKEHCYCPECTRTAK